MPGNGLARTCVESKETSIARPCPFYQKGRCLFEDSCNFMHTVSIKSSTVISSRHTKSPPESPMNPPIVTVESPHSVRSSRSPRLNGLLLALKDVIGEEPDSGYYTSDETTYVDPSSYFDVLKGITVTDTSHSSHTITEEEENHFGSSGSISGLLSTPPVIHDDDETLRQPTRSPNPEAKLAAAITSLPDAEMYPSVPRPPDDLLSPVDLSHLRLSLFMHENNNSTGQDSDSIDSGYADAWQPPFIMAKSPISPLKSTFGILSSPFATATSRVLSPRLSAFISRPPQSPYMPVITADNEDVPSELSLDSPAGDILGAATEDVKLSDEYVVVDVVQATQDLDTNAGKETTEDDDEEDRAGNEEAGPEESDEDETTGEDAYASSWDSDGNPTALYLGKPSVAEEEVKNAIRWSSKIPVRFLSEAIEFNENEATTSSLLRPFDSDSSNSKAMDLSTSIDIHDDDASTNDLETADDSVYDTAPEDSFNSDSFDFPGPCMTEFHTGDISMDDTAQLAYLCSPTVMANENDTLQSLYDQYSDFPGGCGKFASPATVIAELHSGSSLDREEIESLSTATPVRSAFTHERVFTPPPTSIRGRSGTTITSTESHRSVLSPASFKAPLLQERASPPSTATRSAWSPDSAVSEVQEGLVSTKVPFGFRKTSAIGRPSAYTLASSRLSRLASQPAKPSSPLTTPHNPRDHAHDYPPPTSPSTSGLRPLRLSTTLSVQLSSAPLPSSASSVKSYQQPENPHRSSTYYQSSSRASISSTSVLSDASYSRNPLLFLSRPSVIPAHIRNTHSISEEIVPSPLSSIHLRRLATFDSPRSAPLSRPTSWYSHSADDNHPTEFSHDFDRPFSRASEPSFGHEEDEDQEDTINYDNVIRRALPTVPHSAPVDHRVSVSRPPMYAVATPPPTLMFAIASDDVKQVRRVLESGDAGPNDAVGPQSALVFALTNEQLTNKMEIVKTLLAYGADPKTVVQPEGGPPLFANAALEVGRAGAPSNTSLINTLDPAIRYYVERADAPHTRRTSALIHRSFFRPLTRVRYELIGQDQALEQLFKDLSIHSRQLSVSPIVVLLCGPSGHGKSLLARKFGSLLNVPTHTVDMTTIHSAQDLWKSYSMSPLDLPSTRSLAEFLCDNEGKRCVVVLDEIEKTHGESPLWALLMPWEHGRCTFEAHGRFVDVRNVVWLGTSNIGQDLVFEHHSTREHPDDLMSKEEYTELMSLLRPRVSERFGASTLSRVTTVLPFVPFTPNERRAMCYEALQIIAGDIVETLSTDVVDSMVEGALTNYTATEGARSLYRAVSSQLVENI